MRQVFYRLGEAIVEVVGTPDSVGAGPAELWGISVPIAFISPHVRNVS